MAHYAGAASTLSESAPEQREWIEKLRQQGYEAYVCYGAEEAINRIKRYLICG